MFKLERRISMLNSTDASIVNSARLNQISFCDVKVNLKQCFDSSLLWNGMFSGKHISFFYFNFGNAFSVFHSWQTHIVVADIRGENFYAKHDSNLCSTNAKFRQSCPSEYGKQIMLDLIIILSWALFLDLLNS